MFSCDQVAIARATSDGALSATIWDVAVQPSWQRSGLGRAMMERLVRNIVEKGIPTITLYAEPNVVGLYEKLGRLTVGRSKSTWQIVDLIL
jgi:ribosomal protein S18 acetylase RimI-like enzyme